ncbi:hypothetical protein EWM64_g7555 [Hericium alpestre]|uniref:Integrase core domain-containing protein n=1 Tax=Hericium alpestre TaxID=135208 RepID=A0A4Y9ZSJ5_9AGAM|nr:hypothetical protein EWM64_g7555 [Hericium alpestre]
MKPSTNNLALTVLSLFLGAIEEHGAPSRVRGDRGGENIEVSVWMIQHRGPNRASFMWGSSTRNTRIERMWVEVGTQFARRWRAFFTKLEDIHHLNPDDPVHLWLLHRLFLADIDEDCQNFQQDWNHHPISGKAKDQSPADMRLLGQLEHGIYADDYEDVHPDILNRYYGVDVDVEHIHGQTGAGHPDDEEDELPSLRDHIAADQEPHIRHAPIDVPDNGSPFQDLALEAAFFAALSSIHDQGLIPNGYSVAQAEWDDEGYGEVELLKCGRGRKYLEVELPFSIWWPRAVTWAQALDLLNRLQIM